jgi:hypothetical protein
MKLCPRSARALNQPVEDHRAKEWCISMFNAQTCDGCTEGCRPNRRLLSELVPEKKASSKNNETLVVKNEQLRLF